jgi:hypothetical protein
MEEHMRNYVNSLLRISILFVLVLGVIVLAKPKPALAFFDCCQNCANQFQACENNCTGTPLQISACKSACSRQEQSCIEVCPACL